MTIANPPDSNREIKNWTRARITPVPALSCRALVGVLTLKVRVRGGPRHVAVGAAIGRVGGSNVGMLVYIGNGNAVGIATRAVDGCDVGLLVGAEVGTAAGTEIGTDDGCEVGAFVDIRVGTVVGAGIELSTAATWARSMAPASAPQSA